MSQRSYSFPAIFLAVALLFPASSALAVDLCTAAPKTGCLQSGAVELLAALDAADHGKDKLEWRWSAGDAVSASALGDPTAGTDYALCLYDGDATGQTETQAPAPGTDSLLVSIDTPAGASWRALGASGGFLYKAPSASGDGATHVSLAPGNSGELKLLGRGSGLGLAALDAVDTGAVISQLQNGAGACFGATVSVELRNPPPFSVSGFPSADVIDEAKAEATLDELAALYNRKLGADGPLDMTLWTNALGATEIQNLVVTSPTASLDTQALTSALYVFGWYGGTLFQRDGFQGNPGPAGPSNPNPFLFANAVNLFRTGTQVALDGTDQAVFDFLTSNAGGGPGGTGTGVFAAVESFGYNTGYGFAVLEDLINVFNPPANKLVCSGVTAYTPPLGPIHPKFPFAPANAPLFDCVFTPSFLDAGPALRMYLDEYLDPGNANVAALPVHMQPAVLKAAQDGQEGFGSFVWKVVLAGVILQDQEYRESLWDVDNAFLEVVEAAALTGMGALARADADIGRQGVFANGSVLSGWLASYSFGLTAPSGPEPHDPSTDPRVLPLFDLGITPVLALEE